MLVFGVDALAVNRSPPVESQHAGAMVSSQGNSVTSRK